jgi:hypothetical protein
MKEIYDNRKLIFLPILSFFIFSCSGSTNNKNEDLGTESNTSVENLYKNGPLIFDSRNGSWFDRSLTVNGVKIVVAGTVGGQKSVPDEWAKKVARAIELLTNKNDPNIDITAQENMMRILKGGPGTWHEGFPTAQRVAYGAGADYNPNPLTDSGVLSYEGYSTFLDAHSANDMVWYKNSTGPAYFNGDNDIQELFEHLLHTLHLYGVRGAVTGSREALNWDTEKNPHTFQDTALFKAMKEAYSNGSFQPDYVEDIADSSTAHVALKEYLYLLNFNMWEFGSEFWNNQSLSPEWSDSMRTPAGIQAVNPLGYDLYQTYVKPVLSKPDVDTLRSIFQDNDGGVSGYVSD